MGMYSADTPPRPCDAPSLRCDSIITVLLLENNLVALSDAESFAKRRRNIQHLITTAFLAIYRSLVHFDRFSQIRTQRGKS